MIKKTNIETVPFRGGNNTRVEPALLSVGEFSMIQNMRQRHPGMEQRGGMSKLHTTADGTNKVMSMFQFSKGKKTERHFYAQMSDDDVLEATNAPPAVTTGAFGSEVFSGSSSSVPASWSVLDDKLFFSNGVDQHQIYTGTGSYVKRFVVCKDTVAHPTIPTMGEDYSDEVSDGLTTTCAVLDSLGDLAVDYDAIYIMTPVPADTFTWTISKPNGTASVAALKYRKSDDTWAAVSDFVDNTSADSKTLATTGATMTWTLPTDSVPSYMYGEVGYWYQLYLSSGDLDTEVEVTSVTFETDWQSINNLWDGFEVPVVQTEYYDDSADTYKTFSSSGIEIDDATSSDKIYIACADPIIGIYVDVGNKPNTTVDTTVNAVYYWNGAAFTSVGTVTDKTNGLSNSGWITFPRKSAHKHHLNTNKIYAYWYYFTLDKTISADVIISLYYQPYFDIDDFGKGQCNCAWKDRMVYAFDKDQYIHVSAIKRPQVLNGDDYAILEPGDGRSNKVLCMKMFHSELMVWQEEKGKDGGCLTLFEGYSPATFGKVLLSTEIGIMNSKCAAIVEGAKVGTPTEIKITKIAFWLSHYGVFMSNGQYVADVTGSVKNYFNPLESECIRRGYDNEHWLEYDPVENTINIGIVSGSTATVPNVLLVLDLEDMTWSHDVRTPYISCMTNVEAASGNINILQVGGGVADGTVYLLNTGTNDVSTAIDAYVVEEISGKGQNIHTNDAVVRAKVQSAGNITVTPYINSIAQTAKTLSMTAEVTNQTIRRHRENYNLTGQHLSFKYQNSTASQKLYLLDRGYELQELVKQ